MEFGCWGEVLYFGKGTDGHIQPLMPVQSPVVQQQEAIFGVPLSLALHEDGSVWDIEHHTTSAGFHRTRHESLPPSVICNDYVTGKAGTEPFHDTQKTKANRFVGDSERAGVE